MSFEDMEAGGVLVAFDADGSDFGQAVVIEKTGAPGEFDAGAGGGNAAARLAGHDQQADRSAL